MDNKIINTEEDPRDKLVKFMLDEFHVDLDAMIVKKAIQFDEIYGKVIGSGINEKNI